VTEVLLVVVVLLQLAILGLVWHTRPRSPEPAPPPPERPSATDAHEHTASPTPPAAPSSLPPEEQARAELAARWDDVVLRGARAGLVGLPTADEVVRRLDGQAEPSWLVVELGRALRAVMVDRAAVEASEVATRRALEAAAAFFGGLEGEWQLHVDPPRGVPLRSEHWLVDEEMAARFRNPVVNGVIQPIVVLRPALFEDGSCALEGEVA